MAKKKATIENYAVWRRSLVGGIVFAIIYLAIAYIFGSLAIDSGSLWQYLLAIISVAMAVQSLVSAVKNRGNDRKK